MINSDFEFSIGNKGPHRLLIHLFMKLKQFFMQNQMEELLLDNTHCRFPLSFSRSLQFSEGSINMTGFRLPFINDYYQLALQLAVEIAPCYCRAFVIIVGCTDFSYFTFFRFSELNLMRTFGQGDVQNQYYVIIVNFVTLGL